MFVMLIFAPFYSMTVVIFFLSTGSDFLPPASAAVASSFSFEPLVLFGVFFAYVKTFCAEIVFYGFLSAGITYLILGDVY